MPHPEFINAVLRNTPPGMSKDTEKGGTDKWNPLGLDEDHLDVVLHAGEKLVEWDQRVSLVTWRGGGGGPPPSIYFSFFFLGPIVYSHHI